MNARQRGPGAARLDEPTLFRFIVLSLLLHVWFVLLFGSTTGGGARRDYAPGDIFDVRLRQRIDESGSSFRWMPGASESISGAALLPRERASPRPVPTVQHASEGASERAQPAPAPAPRVPAPATTDAAPPAAPAVALPVTEAEPLRRLNPEAPETVDKPYEPKALPLPAAAAPDVVAPAANEVRPAPTTPLDAAPAVAPSAPPASERDIAPSPPREAAPPPARSEVPVTERVPAEAAPRVDVPAAPLPPAPPLPTPSTPPPAIEREPQPPAEKLAPSAPAVEPVPRSEPIAAPHARETVPAAAPSAPAIAEPVTPREQRITPPSAPAATSAPAVPAAAVRGESVPAAPPRLRFGEPTPDEDMFKPRRDTAPEAKPGSAPKLDLDEAKRRAARAIVGEDPGSRGLLSVVPPPPERESKEARALEKAVKPDCRIAYANMGLLATVPLVASAITNSGCRW